MSITTTCKRTKKEAGKDIPCGCKISFEGSALDSVTKHTCGMCGTDVDMKALRILKRSALVDVSIPSDAEPKHRGRPKKK